MQLNKDSSQKTGKQEPKSKPIDQNTVTAFKAQNGDHARIVSCSDMSESGQPDHYLDDDDEDNRGDTNI